MATSWTNNTASYLKSGTNCAITDCTSRDASSTQVGSPKPIMGIYNKKPCSVRLTVVPTTKVKSVTLTVVHQNKAHGYSNYVVWYAKVSTSATAWPASVYETSTTRIGNLPSGGTFTITIDFPSTDSTFYIYLFGYLPADSIGEHTQFINSISSISAVKGGVALRVKADASTWSQASAVYAKTADGWKEVSALYAKTADGWKEAT